MPIIKTPMSVDGNSIRVVRVLRGLSRRKLGERAGIKPWRIFQIEHSVVKPTEMEVSTLMGAMSAEG